MISFRFSPCGGYLYFIRGNYFFKYQVEILFDYMSPLHLFEKKELPIELMEEQPPLHFSSDGPLGSDIVLNYEKDGEMVEQRYKLSPPWTKRGTK